MERSRDGDVVDADVDAGDMACVDVLDIGDIIGVCGGGCTVR